ncbi:hypothetical protein SAMN04487949_0872 [Halogranum gelatinilyticum]|uniref:Uncharacterized protein n=1 Tax=Halogranum gelatinilyticum TaxID=660521 RepID=A0A1G9QI21_9EURY|nr:hypothetical protein [Halogranum gelatinilyticum]SDM10669.1 hypothetical protein SAMN04487949_0872 [Halogranum gelatinilyticum]
MTSAALDVGLCLLLVSASAVTLVTVPEATQPTGETEADAVATLLTTTTATVNYSLSPGARRADEAVVAFPTAEGPEFDRTARGTPATLLAEAAVGGVAVGGDRLTHTRDGLRAAVSQRVAAEVERGSRTGKAGRTETAVQVVTRWQPHRGSQFRGCVTVGSSPPPDAAVHATRVTVPSGLPSARSDAVDAAEGAEEDERFTAVATVVAERVVAGLFPADDLQLALRGDYPVSRFAEYRYRRMGRLFGVDVVGRDGEIHPEAANERLTDAVARAVEYDLRQAYDTPEAAAADVRVDEVTVVVRTWSA